MVTEWTSVSPRRPASATDLLERPLADAPEPELAGGAVKLMLRPLELVTLRLARAGS
ncbi:hypothetical protein [Streptomyces sp. NPDC005407]|uniref:hypothetical protein n=1 Tax=Streptomyces sp. NPDC005407 TaxID=3155340 RepID=UPI0033A31DFA